MVGNTMVVMGNNYANYMEYTGSSLNKEIKNSIRFNKDNLLTLQLVAYMNDTYENYDHRYCPDYDPSTSPISPEDPHAQIFITENGRILISEDGDLFVSELSFLEDYTGELQIFVTSYSDQYFETEGDLEKYQFDKSFLKSCLITLMNKPLCPL